MYSLQLCLEKNTKQNSGKSHSWKSCILAISIYATEQLQLCVKFLSKFAFLSNYSILSVSIYIKKSYKLQKGELYMTEQIYKIAILGIRLISCEVGLALVELFCKKLHKLSWSLLRQMVQELLQENAKNPTERTQIWLAQLLGLLYLSGGGGNSRAGSGQGWSAWPEMRVLESELESSWFLITRNCSRRRRLR